MRTNLALLCSALAVAYVAPLAAQGDKMPEGYRDVIVRKLEAERKILLAMADSMPERLYRDKATPAQRSFAEQVHHAAVVVAEYGPQFMQTPAPTVPDTAATFNTRAGLKAYVNAAYDWGVQTVENQTDQELMAKVAFFGSEVPCWQVWDEFHMHTLWTAGQVVANFRKHGMAPPAFGFF